MSTLNTASSLPNSEPAATPEQVAELIRFIHDFAKLDGIGPDTELIDSGLLSSIEMVDIIVYVNKKYQVDIEPADIVPENFCTPRRIIGFALAQRAS